jgi:hypothetical protein
VEFLEPANVVLESLEAPSETKVLLLQLVERPKATRL